MTKRVLKTFDVSTKRFVNVPVQLIYRETDKRFALKWDIEKGTNQETKENPKKFLLVETNFVNYKKKILMAPCVIPLLEIVHISVINKDYHYLSFSNFENQSDDNWLQIGEHNIKQKRTTDEVKKIIKRGIIFVKKKENGLIRDYTKLLHTDFFTHDMCVLKTHSTQRNFNSVTTADKKNNTLSSNGLYDYLFNDCPSSNVLCINENETNENLPLINTLSENKENNITKITNFLVEILKNYERTNSFYSKYAVLLFHIKNCHINSYAYEILFLKYFVKVDTDSSTYEENDKGNKMLLQLSRYVNEAFNYTLRKLEKWEKKKRDEEKKLQLLYFYIRCYENKKNCLETDFVSIDMFTKDVLKEEKTSDKTGNKIGNKTGYISNIYNTNILHQKQNVNKIKDCFHKETQLWKKGSRRTMQNGFLCPLIINKSHTKNNDSRKYATHLEDNIYTLYYQNKNKAQNFFSNEINTLLKNFSLKQIRAFVDKQFVEQMYQNYSFFLIIQKLHKHNRIAYLHPFAEFYNSFNSFYDFFYKYWKKHRNIPVVEKQKNNPVYDLQFFHYLIYKKKSGKEIIGKKNRDRKHPSFFEMNIDNGLLKEADNQKERNRRHSYYKENRMCDVESIYTGYRNRKQEEKYYELPDQQSEETVDENEQFHAVKRSTFFKKRKHGYLDKVIDLLSYNFEHLKILEALVLTTTNSSFLQYLFFFKKKEYVSFFFENNKKLIKLIFLQYYHKGYIDTCIFYKQQKVNTHICNTLISLFTQYCNFPDYFQFWNYITATNSENRLFVPIFRKNYDLMFNEYVHKLMNNLNKIWNKNTQNKLLQRITAERTYSSWGGKQYYYIYRWKSGTVVKGIDWKRGKMHNSIRSGKRRRIKTYGTYKKERKQKINCNYRNGRLFKIFHSCKRKKETDETHKTYKTQKTRCDIKTRWKQIDKRNFFFLKSQQNYPIYLLKLLKKIIWERLKNVRTETYKVIAPVFSPDIHLKKLYNFFIYWDKKSKTETNHLINIFNISLNVKCLDEFFADILFCFFIGNL